VLFTNSRGEEFFGLRAALTIGKNLLSDLHLLVNPEAFYGFVDQVFASGSLHGREVAFRTPDGENRWALLSASAISFDGEDAVIIALQDITGRKAMMDRLQLADQFFRTTTEGIVVTDADGFIEDGNPALEELTGYTLEEIRGGRPGMFSAQRVHSETSERFWDSLRRNGAWQGEVWNRRKDGEAYPVWLTVTAVKDSEGKVTHYAGVLTHIGDIKMEQQRLSHMAYHDSLTGLPNRYLLMDRLEMVIARARRERSIAAAVFIDLDEFKEVNDTYGHETGDLLLVSVARRLTETVREQDTVARLGGDEFVLVLDGFFSREEVEGFLARIYDAFSEPFPAGGRLLAVRGSLGVALFPDDGSTASELIARADEKMYFVKSKHREGRIS
jgi:diguanylate cyclase (GGDEF)-like protein/PAS domain S-box-containing protein